jgi:class 3 adenylate cyclase
MGGTNMAAMAAMAASPAVSASGKVEVASARRGVAVFLYAELRGFTGMAQMLEPQTVLGLLQDFHAFTAERIRAHGGRVLHRLGDTLLAVFEGPRDVAGAVKASQAIVQDFAQIEQAWREGYGLNTAISMGLHRGEAVLTPGEAIGECVGIAQRLLQRARAGEFVLSTAILDALIDADVELDAEPLPPLETPRRPAMRIYGVLINERLDFT